MYNVIITSIEGKRYYHSYVESNAVIECNDLPPYQDINKARSCYWDDEKWIFDEERYKKILSDIEREAEKKASVPSNEELKEMTLCTMAAVNELIGMFGEVIQPLSQMALLLKGVDD